MIQDTSQTILPLNIFDNTTFITNPTSPAHIALCLIHHSFLAHMVLSKNIGFVYFPFVAIVVTSETHFTKVTFLGV
jgi:hypothetical protein